MSKSADHKQDSAAPLVEAGLGDVTERFFAALGVTQERYKAAKAAVGLEPDCNCDARKKWLNELGSNLGVDSVVIRLARWLDRQNP